MIQELATPPAAARYSFDAEAHVHRLDGAPLYGTSTVCKVIGKPLTWWAAGMSLTPLGWLNPRKAKKQDRLNAAAEALGRLHGMTSIDEYEALLQECYRAHNTRKETAAVTGTDMHRELETYVKNCIYIGRGEPMVASPDCCEAETRFADWALNNVQEFLWSEGHCYSERLWTGGICDCGALLKSGKVAVIDFKSSKEAYFDQFVQTGGYRVQIQENGLFNSDGTRLYPVTEVNALMVFPFGADATEPSKQLYVNAWSKAFEGAVTLHQLKQEFELAQ